MPGARAARKVMTAGVAALAFGIALSGCGHSATVGADRTLRVALTEYRVVPQKVRVSAGLLTIIVHNLGKLTHNLVVLEGNERVDQTKAIWPGSVGELIVNLPPGKYTLASTLFSDQALGEFGTLTVSS